MRSLSASEGRRTSAAGTVLRLLAGLVLLGWAAIALARGEGRPLLPALVGGYLLVRGVLGALR